MKKMEEKSLCRLSTLFDHSQYDTSYLIEVQASLTFFIFCINIFYLSSVNGQQATIHIYNSTKSNVNRKVLGKNILGYNYMKGNPSRGKQSSMQGSGLWNPIDKKPVNKVIQFLLETGTASIRWPGGCGVHNFNWKKTVGPLIERPNQVFGLPEFLYSSKLIGADPIITLADYWGDPVDFADMVEYLNSPIGANLNGGMDWASIRLQDGHPEPHNVIWFEYGNETYHGDHNLSELSVSEYIKQYRNVYFAMKAIDKDIKIGAVLKNGSIPELSYWTMKVIEGTGDIADFYIHHAYLPNFNADVPSGKVYGWTEDSEKTKELFKLTFASTKQFEKYYSILNQYIFKTTGKRIPLSITEFNGHFVQGKPIPYRHTLGNAVYVADLIQLFINPDNNIINANYWQFSNEYWGLIRGLEPSYEDDEYWKFSEKYWGEKKQSNPSYLKRPNYYVYKLYNDHLGDSLLNIDVSTEQFFTEGGFGIIPIRKDFEYIHLFRKEILPSKPKWNIIKMVGVNANQLNDGTLFVNIFTDENINYYHSNITIPVVPNTGYIVTAEIRTSGIENNYGARIDIQDGRGFNNNIHSWVGSNEVHGTEWTTVSCSYIPLLDAENIKIIARRLGSNGPCQFWIRNLIIKPFHPSNDDGIPYITAVATKRNDLSISVIIINRDLDSSVSVELKLETNINNAWAETLNGRYVDDTNEVIGNNCVIRPTPLTILNSSVLIHVPPHSVTAVRID
jgi:alpha-L-arabinofuranosidase